MNNNYFRCFALAFGLIGGCATQGVEDPTTLRFNDIDKLHDHLAERARNIFYGNDPNPPADDFNIGVSLASYPIGTLIRPSRTIPIDYTACQPSSENGIPTSSTPTIFPTYELNKKTAIDIGLISETLPVTDLLRFKVSDADTVTLKVSDPKIKVLSDNDIESIFKSPSCIKAINDNTVWIVRGYILGHRTIILKGESGIDLGSTIPPFPSFKVTSGPNSESLSIVDSGDKEFLQIVSQVSVPEDFTVSSAPTPKQTDIFKKPTIIDSTGRLYIQKDRRDKSANADVIASKLIDSGFNVVPDIESIDSSRMPKIAQVRYFNDSDTALAERALNRLKQLFPTAISTKINLPAPKGQLEIWLPKY
ncbi:hypothetical protein GCM10027040_13160 [Halomonas shantousis]